MSFSPVYDLSEPDTPRSSFKRFSKGLMTRGYRTRSPRKNLGVLTPESLKDRSEEDRSIYTQSPLSRFQDGSTFEGGFFGSVSESSSPQGETRSRASKLNFSKRECCFCDELLTESLPGEQALHLTCDHTCHYNCLVVLLDKHSLNQLPFCPKCRISTCPSDDCTWENMTNAALLHDQKEEPEISAQVLFANPNKDVNEPVTPVDRKAISSVENNRGMDDSLSPTSDVESGPQIAFRSSLSKVIIASDSPCRLKCYLSVRNRTCKPAVEIEPEEKDLEVRERIEMDILESMGRLIQDVTPASFGRLFVFDYIEVSQDEELWDTMQCLLFENVMVLVCKTNPSLSAVVDTRRDLVSVDSCESSMCLTLSTNLVSCPELLLKFEGLVLLRKWHYIISTSSQDQRTAWIDQPAAHLSTNAWDCLSDPSLVPPELHQLKGPMTPVTPRWEPTQSTSGQPRMLSILIIPLVNKSGLSLHNYNLKIRRVVSLFLESLGDEDEFGLVKIGRDELNEKSNSATFIGCINRAWEGWTDVVNDIEAYNDDDNIFGDSSEEVEKGLKFCEQLLSSVFESDTKQRNNMIKKVFLVNCYNFSTNVPFTSTEAVRVALQHLVDTWKVSLSCLQVGDYYSYGMLSILKCASDFQKNESRCVYGTESQRFVSFDSLFASIKTVVSLSKKAAFPELSIQIAACPGVRITAIENSEQIKGSNCTNLAVDLYNLGSEAERIIMVELELVVGTQNLRNGAFWDFPLVNVSSSFNGDTKTLTAHAQVGISISPTNSIGRLALTNDGEDELYMDIPLLPPLSIQRDASYIKRQVELLVSQQLSLWLKTGDTTSLSNIVSVIWGITRGYSSSMITLKEKKIKLNDYVEILIGRVNEIVEYLGSNEEYCKTLAHDLYAELHF